MNLNIIIVLIILNFYLTLLETIKVNNNLRNIAKPLINKKSKIKSKESLKVRSNLDFDTLNHIEPVSSNILLDSVNNKVNNVVSIPLDMNSHQNHLTSNFKNFVENSYFLMEKNYYNIVSSIPWTELYEFKDCIDKNCKLQKTRASYEICLYQCQEKIIEIIKYTN